MYLNPFDCLCVCACVCVCVVQDRWCWLQQYHGWLQAQAQLRMNKIMSARTRKPKHTNNGDEDANGSEHTPREHASNEGQDDEEQADNDTETIYDRVCLMETSVLLQSEELERAKIVFLKVCVFVCMCVFVCVCVCVYTFVQLCMCVQTNSELMTQLESANKEREERADTIRTQLQRINSLESELAQLRQQQQEQTQHMQTNTQPIPQASLPINTQGTVRKPPQPPGPPPPPTMPPPPQLPQTHTQGRTQAHMQGSHTHQTAHSQAANTFTQEQYLASLRMSPVPPPPTTMPPPPSAAAIMLMNQHTHNGTHTHSSTHTTQGLSPDDRSVTSDDSSSYVPAFSPIGVSNNSNSRQSATVGANTHGNTHQSSAAANSKQATTKQTKQSLTQLSQSQAQSTAKQPSSIPKPTKSAPASSTQASSKQKSRAVEPSEIPTDKTISKGALSSSSSSSTSPRANTTARASKPSTTKQPNNAASSGLEPASGDKNNNNKPSNRATSKPTVKATGKPSHDDVSLLQLVDTVVSNNMVSAYDALNTADSGNSDDPHSQRHSNGHNFSTYSMEAEDVSDSVESPQYGVSDKGGGVSDEVESSAAAAVDDMEGNINGNASDASEQDHAVEISGRDNFGEVYDMGSLPRRISVSGDDANSAAKAAAITSNVFARINISRERNKSVSSTIVTPNETIETGEDDVVGVDNEMESYNRLDELPAAWDQVGDASDGISTALSRRNSGAAVPIPASSSVPSSVRRISAVPKSSISRSGKVDDVNHDSTYVHETDIGVDATSQNSGGNSKDYESWTPKIQLASLPAVVKRRNTLASAGSAASTLDNNQPKSSERKKSINRSDADAVDNDTTSLAPVSSGVKDVVGNPRQTGKEISSARFSPSTTIEYSSSAVPSSGVSDDTNLDSPEPEVSEAPATGAAITSAILKENKAKTLKVKERKVAKRNSQADLLAMAEEILNRHKNKLVQPSPTKKSDLVGGDETKMLAPGSVAEDSVVVTATVVSEVMDSTDVQRAVSDNALPGKKAKKSKPLWKEYVDAASGDSYFHNKLTGETVWERPSEEEMRLVIVDGVAVIDTADI
jgi:hypothetical protein